MENIVDYYSERVVDIEFIDSPLDFDLNINHEKMIRIFNDLVGWKFEIYDYEEYCEVFKRDLIMEIIYDSTTKIINFFENTTTAKNKFKKLYKEIYFSDNRNFSRQLYYALFNPKIDAYLDNASESYYRLIPKVFFPWYIYGLSKVIEDRMNKFENIHKIFDPKKMPLFNIRNDVDKLIKQGIDDLNIYIEILKAPNRQFNSSLNLLIFSKETGLLDVFQLARIINLNYIGLEKDQMDYPKIYSDIKKSSESTLRQYLALTNMQGLFTKLFFFNSTDLDITNLSYKEIIRRYNAFFTTQKNYIKSKIIEDVKLSIQIDIPSELVDEVLLYFLLKKDEPYRDYFSNFEKVQCLDNFFKNAYRVAYEALYNWKKENNIVREQCEQCEQSTHNDSPINKGAREYLERISTYNRNRTGGKNEQPPDSY